MAGIENRHTALTTELQRLCTCIQDNGMFYKLSLNLPEINLHPLAFFTLCAGYVVYQRKNKNAFQR